jgi:hypothetical protein
MSLPAKKQLQVCLLLSVLGVGLAATDAPDGLQEKPSKDFKESIAPSSGNLDFADEFGTLTDADMAALNLSYAADRLQKSLRVVVGPGQCDGILEMTIFDQMSMEQLSALYNDYSTFVAEHTIACKMRIVLNGISASKRALSLWRI